MMSSKGETGGCQRSRRKRLVACVLAAEMVIGPAFGVLTPTLAFAADPSLTIKRIEGVSDSDTSYQYVQVFSANIDDNNNASALKWVEEVKADTLAYLNENGYEDWLETQGHKTDAGKTDPQNAAEFIALKINNSANAFESSEAKPPKVADSFAYGLAQKLASHATAASGNTITGPEGYYLVFTTQDSDNHTLGTAPIWVPLGGSIEEITEKAAIPTLKKQVSVDQLNSGAGSTTNISWGKAADANTGQNLWYRLSTKLPENILAFNTYKLAITDTLGKDLRLAGNDDETTLTNVSSVKVVAYPTEDAMNADKNATSFGTGGVDITELFAKSYTYDKSGASDKNILSVSIDNLFSAAAKEKLTGNQAITSNSYIAVYYQAHLTSAADKGATANTTHAARLTYSSDPMNSSATKTTAETSTSTYTYTLKMTKHDKVNGDRLSGAKFSVQVADSSTDVASKNLYVQADGSLGSSPYYFVTADGTGGTTKGDITIPGIDEGVYIIQETEAPASYEKQDSDITLTVTSTLNQETGEISTLEATVSGGELEATDAPDMKTRMGSIEVNTTSGAIAHHTEVTDGVDKNSGIITLMTVDERTITMPITGMYGPQFVMLCGASLVVVGFVGGAALRRRKHTKTEL